MFKCILFLIIFISLPTQAIVDGRAYLGIIDEPKGEEKSWDRFQSFAFNYQEKLFGKKTNMGLTFIDYNEQNIYDEYKLELEPQFKIKQIVRDYLIKPQIFFKSIKYNDLGVIKSGNEKGFGIEATTDFPIKGNVFPYLILGGKHTFITQDVNRSDSSLYFFLGFDNELSKNFIRFNMEGFVKSVYSSETGYSYNEYSATMTFDIIFQSILIISSLGLDQIVYEKDYGLYDKETFSFSLDIAKEINDILSAKLIIDKKFYSFEETLDNYNSWQFSLGADILI